MDITDSQKIDVYYNALLERDQKYVDTFFVGIKSTSVFCIANCTARKPKQENTVFYTRLKDALDNGYRPCKICKPTQNANPSSKEVKEAIGLVESNLKEKVSDTVLRQNNINPERVRRWFHKNYGISFHTFQRMYRINYAYQELKTRKQKDDDITNSTANSLNGFGYTLRERSHKEPKQTLKKNLILLNRVTTPLGPMFIGATNEGICMLEFVDRRMLETEFKDLQHLLNAQIVLGENRHVKQAREEIKEYFDGIRKQFDVKLLTPGTIFQNTVWQSLRNIDYGKTTTYQEQSQSINNPKAIRAMASANGFNRIAIIIPCHRVIGKDGNLTGYGGGLERKRWLIQHEQKNIGLTLF